MKPYKLFYLIGGKVKNIGDIITSKDCGSVTSKLEFGIDYSLLNFTQNDTHNLAKAIKTAPLGEDYKNQIIYITNQSNKIVGIMPINIKGGNKMKKYELKQYDDYIELLENGNVIYFKTSDGISWESTYDERGNQLTYKSNTGFSWERTYDEKGNALTYNDSYGYSWGRTYDENGNMLTFKEVLITKSKK